MIDKNAIFSHFKSILDDMIAHSVWFKTYIQNPCYVDVVCGDNGYNFPSNISICTGATRACIVDDSYDWVVKFDINEDRRGGACEREMLSYARACNHKLSQYFAEVEYIGNYYAEYKFFDGYDVEDYIEIENYYNFKKNFYLNSHRFGTLRTIVVNIPLYAYRKIEFQTGYGQPVSKEEMKIINRYKSPLSERNYCAAAKFLRQYGIDEYQNLSNFLIEEDINDLHSQNAGFFNGNFIIIDYAGYFDPECNSSYDEEEDE